VLLLNRLLDLVETLHEDDDIECDLNSILLSRASSTIPKWEISVVGATFELFGRIG
jgi:hypothetical protein